MSEWYTPRGDDIEIDPECSQVNVLVTSNYWGNVYAVLTFDQIQEINQKIIDTKEAQD